MESETYLHILPSASSRFRPYAGQAQVADCYKSSTPPEILTVQCPTGYGKTILSLLAAKELIAKSAINRILYVVANDTQREQVWNDIKADARMVGLGGVEPWKIEREGRTEQVHLEGKATVFITTIQMVESRSGVTRGKIDTIAQLMRSGTWLVVCDEYHHYGDGRAWGESLRHLCRLAKYTLAMSATPYNRTTPTIFGTPSIVVTFRQALEEQAVKPCELKSAKYQTTFIDAKGNPHDMTTCELREAVGKDKVDAYIRRRILKHSDKYVEPIVVRAIASMMRKNGFAPNKVFQVLIRAYSCSHARSLASSIARWTDLSVDWVGTGPDGRPDRENEEVLAKFVPRKRTLPNGQSIRPEPSIAILIQVSKAGEGFDSVNVTDIVDLSLSTFTDPAVMDRQFFGRGDRVIYSSSGRVTDDSGNLIKVTYWVPSDHPLAPLHANSDLIVEWKNGVSATQIEIPDPNQDPTPDPDDLFDITIGTKLADRLDYCELINIMEDDRAMFVADRINAERKCAVTSDGRLDLSDPEQFDWFAQVYREGSRRFEEPNIRQANIETWSAQLNRTVGQVASQIERIKFQGHRVSTSQIGDLKRRINKHIASRLGYRESFTSREQFEAALQILKELCDSIRTTKCIPMWCY